MLEAKVERSELAKKSKALASASAFSSSLEQSSTTKQTRQIREH